MFRKLASIIGTLVAFSLIVAGGAVHGWMTNRWQEASTTDRIAGQLRTLPTSVGSWQMTDEEPIDDRTLKILECSGHLSRTYVDSGSGAKVKVAVLVGPHGPIAVHTPEICYSSRDFEIENERVAVDIDSRDGYKDDAWKLTLRSRDIHANRLRVYYGWTVDGVWQAAANPRFSYAGQPYLLKLQVAGIVSMASDDSTSDPCLRFLQDFLPQLRRDLFSNSNKSAPGGADGN